MKREKRKNWGARSGPLKGLLTVVFVRVDQLMCFEPRQCLSHATRRKTRLLRNGPYDSARFASRENHIHYTFAMVTERRSVDVCYCGGVAGHAEPTHTRT